MYADSSVPDSNPDGKYGVYTQQQLNRITGGAYMTRQQLLIQSAKVRLGQARPEMESDYAP